MPAIPARLASTSFTNASSNFAAALRALWARLPVSNISPSTSNGKTNPISTSSSHAYVFLASRAGSEILYRSPVWRMPDARSVSSLCNSGRT